MKYFLDTEFIEAFHRPPFGLGRRRHFIDLISIGIVAEDGRKYYAISNEFNEKKASKWVQDNVIGSIIKSFSGDQRNHLLDISIKGVKRCFGKSNKQIAAEIMQFVNPDLYWPVESYSNSELRPGNGHPMSVHFDKHNVDIFRTRQLVAGSPTYVDYYCAQPEFYGYYADYDWVLFASLFGTMDNLPPGFPMYCKDLNQMFDEKFDKTAHRVIKALPDYPKQTNEHNALADAKWNMQLYNFLMKII